MCHVTSIDMILEKSLGLIRNLGKKQLTRFLGFAEGGRDR